MSVHVEIEIAPSGFRTQRHLEINRIADGDRPGDPHTYEVILSRPTRSSTRPRAEFEHNFHDDVLTLITEAIAALRLEGVVQA